MLDIYVDGSSRKTGLGAWAYQAWLDDEIIHSEHGVVENTTNNVMELSAVIAALVYVKTQTKNHKVRIFCDSQYVVKGLTEWWDRWERKGFWINGKQVKNLHVWLILRPLHINTDYQLIWIKGHANNDRHNQVDKLVSSLTGKPNK